MTSLKSYRALKLITATALLSTFGALSALADIQTITINTANTGLDTSAGTCCTGPYATVTINRSSATSATISFDSLTNGGFTYLIGSQNGAGVNVHGAFSVSGITGSNSLSGFSFNAASDLSNGGASNMDGFGNFNETIAFFDGFAHTATHLQFTLTATGTNSWATAAAVLTPNANGREVVYHGFSCAVTCTGAGSATSTGFASNGNGTTVPEPTSLGLSALLVGLLSVAGRCVKQRKPAVES